MLADDTNRTLAKWILVGFYFLVILKIARSTDPPCTPLGSKLDREERRTTIFYMTDCAIVVVEPFFFLFYDTRVMRKTRASTERHVEPRRPESVFVNETRRNRRKRGRARRTRQNEISIDVERATNAETIGSWLVTDCLSIA